MNTGRERIIRSAITHFGPEAQKNKAIEELSELIRALARNDDQGNINEEMADVRIMLDQLEIIFGNHDAVRSAEYAKLIRLNLMLRNEKDGGADASG